MVRPESSQRTASKPFGSTEGRDPRGATVWRSWVVRGVLLALHYKVLDTA
jgi:hypothetical protein